MTSYNENAERAIAQIYDDSIPGDAAWSRYIDREVARLRAECACGCQDGAA